MVLFAATGVTINARYRTMPKFKTGKTTRLTHSPVTDLAKKITKIGQCLSVTAENITGSFLWDCVTVGDPIHNSYDESP